VSLLDLGAAAVAAAVRSGEVTAAEITEEALARVEATEGELHCFHTVLSEAARREAARVDEAVRAGADPGPLAGVPVALKDNLCTRGVETTCSSRILEGWRPPYDATVVERLRSAGAVAIGKTNLDEFAMGSSTENSAFGPTRNPWDPGRVPGGSSGGSAAAVAAGVAPLAFGSDTGGSIRQPASLCGVVGIKPTYGVVSRYGLIAFASSLDQIGPFAPTVADAALALEVIAGRDPRDSTCLERPAPRLRQVLGRGVQGLRVGVLEDFVDDVSDSCRRAANEAADALAAAGAKVDAISIPEARLGLPAYYVIAPAEASSNLARYDGVRYGLRVDGPDVEAMNARTRAAGFGREVRRRIMIGTYALSAGYYDAYYGQAQRVRTLVTRAFEAAYERFDVLVSSTTPSEAFEFGAKTANPIEMYLSDLCTVSSNLTGHPAISVPFTLGDAGLPVGVQVMAPALGEAVMVQVAAAIEAVAPREARGPVAIGGHGGHRGHGGPGAPGAPGGPKGAAQHA
jgi:aspartyl-tRNA(Asn)/glutamyl-tRNA(Gln) amidotransferase subunit A